MDRVKNAYWRVELRSNPYMLAPGEYEVVDSDPETWSWNEQSQGSGISCVKLAVE